MVNGLKGLLEIMVLEVIVESVTAGTAEEKEFQIVGSATLIVPLNRRLSEQVLPKVIWEQTRRKVPIGYNGTPHPQNSFPKLPLPVRLSPPPSNTPIPRPTPLTIPNGIRIHSAVLPQYTFWTDRPTDRHTDQQMG